MNFNLHNADFLQPALALAKASLIAQIASELAVFMPFGDTFTYFGVHGIQRDHLYHQLI